MWTKKKSKDTLKKKNVVVVDNIEELKDKILYHINNPKVTKRKIDTLHKHVLKKHNHSIREKELIKIVKMYLSCCFQKVRLSGLHTLRNHFYGFLIIIKTILTWARSASLFRLRNSTISLRRFPFINDNSFYKNR